MNEIDPSKYIDIINKKNGNKKDKDIGIKKYLRRLAIRVFIPNSKAESNEKISIKGVSIFFYFPFFEFINV